jgi:hypothetical protein
MGFTTIARQRGMGNTVASHGKRNSKSRADQELARTSINRDLSPPESQQKNNVRRHLENPVAIVAFVALCATTDFQSLSRALPIRRPTSRIVRRQHHLRPYASDLRPGACR